MWHNLALPARLTGVLDPGLPDVYVHPPYLRYAVIPLPPSEVALVEFVLLKAKPDADPGVIDDISASEQLNALIGSSHFEACLQAAIRHRGVDARRLAQGTGFAGSVPLPIFGPMPATEVAWTWLSSDLNLIGFRNNGERNERGSGLGYPDKFEPRPDVRHLLEALRAFTMRGDHR
jgi:hypothetical protein